MSALEKTAVLARVASSGLPKRKVLGELGVPKSTYYRWLRRKDQQGLEDDAGERQASMEQTYFLGGRQRSVGSQGDAELSPRQLASWVTDNMGFSVSESTVYRILRREGLVKRSEMRLVAGKEYHRKTPAPHQMWATMPPTSGGGLGLLLPGHRDGRLFPASSWPTSFNET